MRQQHRNICLLIDNFSGHFVDYKPHNIHVEYFKPNLTSYVQPCDAGIIRTTKALYRHAFCLRAMELDDAGERDIYKIDLREAMLLVVEAWNKVKPSTIINCWNHTKIQLDPEISPITAAPAIGIPLAPFPTGNTAAWILVREFAISDEMRLPEVEKQLQDLLGSSYTATDWDPVLKIVMDAENNVEKALEGLDHLTVPIFGCPIGQLSVTHISQLPTPLAASSDLPQLFEAETDLSNAVNSLRDRKRIIGTPLTLEEMLNPVEELEVGDSMYRFENGDGEIVAQVNHEMAVRRGEVMEVNDEPEEDHDSEPEMELSQVIQLCEKMERMSIKYGTLETSLGVSRSVRKLRIELRRMESARLKQATLGRWFGDKGMSQ